MAAPLVVSRASGDARALGGLFEGVSFFLVQRLPQRSSFVEKVQNNGGRVVKLEAQADHVIADHVRKDCPPGSISYTFIDAALRDAALPDPDDHAAGPPVGAIRDVGSHVPGKQTRTAFSAEDDRVLWQWVERAKAEGGMVKGNDIYKQLEARNSRHTFQAWRDRYIKKLMTNPPAGVALKVAANAPPSPPEALDGDTDVKTVAIEEGQKAKSPTKKRTIEELESVARTNPPQATFRLPRGSRMAPSVAKPGPQKPVEPLPQSDPMDEDDVEQMASNEFDETDLELLMGEAEDIVRIDESQREDAWRAYAEAYSSRTAEEWQAFWETKVHPEYVRRQKQRKDAKRRRALERKRETEKPKVKLAKTEAAKLANGHEADEGVDDDVTAFLPNPESRSSQKRKLAPPTSSVKTTYGRKKLRADVSSLFADAGDEDEQRTAEEAPPKQSRQAKRSSMSVSRIKPSTQPIEILSDSEDEAEAAESKAYKTKRVDVDRSHENQLTVEDDPTHVDQLIPSDISLCVDKEMPSDLPTSEAVYAADEQLRREAREPQEARFEPISPQQLLPEPLTLDIDRAAAQLVRRTPPAAELTEAEEAIMPGQHDPNLATSDANRVPKQQPPRKSRDLDPLVDEPITSSPRPPAAQLGLPRPDDDIVISNHLVEDGEVEDGLPGEELIDVEEGGDALTEANLASQQAQQKEPLLRGADLPEDDEMKDQTDYVSYLEQLVGRHAEVKPGPLKERASIMAPRAVAEAKAEAPTNFWLAQLSKTQDDGLHLPHSGGRTQLLISTPPAPTGKNDDLLDQTPYTHHQTAPDHPADGLAAHAAPELQLSSQQEVDDVLEANLEWPWKSQVMPETNTLPFETQVAYPDLQAFGAAEGRANMFLSQLAQPEEISAHPGPLTSSQPLGQGRPKVFMRADDRDNRHDEVAEYVGENAVRKPFRVGIGERARSPLPQNGGSEDSDLPMFTRDEENVEEERDGHIDLTIPEPEGGFDFGFSSSPAKSIRSQPPARATEYSPPASSARVVEVEGLEDDASMKIEDFIEEPNGSEHDAEMKQAGEEVALPNKASHGVLEISSASSSSSLPESSAPSSSAVDEEQVPGKALETQDIMAAETQPLDLEVPLPPDSDDEFEELPSDPLVAPSPPSEPVRPRPVATPQPSVKTPQARRLPAAKPQSNPRQASQRKFNESQKIPDDDLDEYIATMTVRYKVAEGAIINALLCTSMRPELAELVLLEEKAGLGLPDDVPGVWTEAEDRAIEGGDARSMRAVTERHGWDEVLNRIKFLEEWRNV